MLPPPPPGFADGLGLPPFQAHLLYNRDVRERGQVEPFLNSDSDLRNDPLLLPDMEKGVRRLERALRSGECIGVFGDFDTDGVNDFEEYAASPMNFSPMDVNSTGSDGVPFRVKTAFGLAPLQPYGFMVSGIELDDQGRPVVRWPALANGSAAGGASGQAVQSNNGVTITYQLQYSVDLVNWYDVDGSNAVTYDAVAGEFEYVDDSGLGANFYRFSVTWSE